MVRYFIMMVLACGLVAGCGDSTRHVSCDRDGEDAEYEWDAGAEPDEYEADEAGDDGGVGDEDDGGDLD